MRRDATRADEAHLFETVYVAAAEVSGFVSGNAEMPGTHAGRDRAGSTPDWFIEKLSDRELEVLEQLPTQLTYPEIADLLYVSANTVKTHAKLIGSVGDGVDRCRIRRQVGTSAIRKVRWKRETRGSTLGGLDAASGNIAGRIPCQTSAD